MNPSRSGRIWIANQVFTHSIALSGTLAMFDVVGPFPLEPAFDKVRVCAFSVGIDDTGNSGKLQCQGFDGGIQFLSPGGAVVFTLQLATEWVGALFNLPDTGPVAIQPSSPLAIDVDAIANLSGPIASAQFFAEARVNNSDAGAAHTLGVQILGLLESLSL